jgi:hypothetical protein
MTVSISNVCLLSHRSNHLMLSEADKRHLEIWDYQISDWEQGRLLRYSDKYADLDQMLARRLPSPRD